MRQLESQRQARAVAEAEKASPSPPASLKRPSQLHAQTHARSASGSSLLSILSQAGTPTGRATGASSGPIGATGASTGPRGASTAGRSRTSVSPPGDSHEEVEMRALPQSAPDSQGVHGVEGGFWGQGHGAYLGQGHGANLGQGDDVPETDEQEECTEKHIRHCQFHISFDTIMNDSLALTYFLGTRYFYSTRFLLSFISFVNNYLFVVFSSLSSATHFS